jgi:hypothetical protein
VRGAIVDFLNLAAEVDAFRFRYIEDSRPDAPIRSISHVYYVYLLQSVTDPNRRYTGFTRDLRPRLAAHNAGQICPLLQDVLGDWSRTPRFHWNPPPSPSKNT